LATGSACIPGKSQILGMWSSEEVLPTDSFLHMAFERAATTGNTFITFELNQSNKTWVNGARATIPCRSDGDVLLSFTPTSTPIVTANVWTGDGTGPAACPDGATGSFAASSSFNFEGAVNSAAISNYLSPGAL